MDVKPGGAIRSHSRLALTGFVLALASGAVELLAGFGTRGGLWDYRQGFYLFRLAAYGGIAAGLISVAGCFAARSGRGRRGLAWAVAGLLIALVVSGVPWSMQQLARKVSAIHDITTAPDDPPRFAALLSLRQATANGAEYGGPQIASKQREAYPDIAPLDLSLSPAAAYDRAILAARSLGWEVIASDKGAGSIEATATTFWFGFKDDVVIRVRPMAGGSRIDVRSVSRVGKSDLGANARRILKFTETVRGFGGG